MDPNLEGRRKTIIQRLAYNLTQTSVIKERLQPGKFPASIVGVVKIIAIILLLSAAVAFLSISICPKTDDWYAWLLPLATCSGAAITIIFYAIFTLGLAVKYPGFWFVSDIVACIVLAVFIISTSVVTMTACTSTNSGATIIIPGPLGICGAVFLIFAGAGLYIMYRNKDEIKVQEIQPRLKSRSRQAPKRNHSLSEDVDV